LARAPGEAYAEREWQGSNAMARAMAYVRLVPFVAVETF